MKKIILTLFLALAFYSSQSQYIISTIAGTGVAGFSGDGGLATAAQISSPLGVAVDHQGNILFPDPFNNRIRRIDAITGIITTIAGNGATTNSGDGGPATSASLYNPKGICIDDSGNIYVTCMMVVRKISTTGIITKVAGSATGGYSGDGGPATSAQMGTTVGIAVDHSGNLYIADQGSKAIRKVTKATGIITSLAGNGVAGFSGDGGPASGAQLSGPLAVALDKESNVYIGDNNRIRKIDVATGIINTIGGTGTGGYTGDGGHVLAASFFTPSGLSIDDLGNIYFADQGSSVVRKVAATTQTISTIAGTGTAGFSGDGGPAVFAELNIDFGVFANSNGSVVYIADKINNRIRKLVNPNTISITDISATKLDIYPNPSDGKFFIAAYGLAGDLVIVNSVGQQVYKGDFTDRAAIDLAPLPSGFYFLQLSTAQGTIKDKLIVSR